MDQRAKLLDHMTKHKKVYPTCTCPVDGTDMDVVEETRMSYRYVCCTCGYWHIYMKLVTIDARDGNFMVIHGEKW